MYAGQFKELKEEIMRLLYEFIVVEGKIKKDETEVDCATTDYSKSIIEMTEQDEEDVHEITGEAASSEIKLMSFNKIWGTLGWIYCRIGLTLWKKYYGFYKDGCIYLYSKMNNTTFDICYCLLNVDIDQYNDKVEYPDNKESEQRMIMNLSHNYEY